MQRPRTLKPKLKTIHIPSKIADSLTYQNMQFSEIPQKRQTTIQIKIRNLSQMQRKTTQKQSIQSLKVLNSEKQTFSASKKPLFTERNQQSDDMDLSFIDPSNFNSGLTTFVWTSPFRDYCTVYFPYPEICKSNRTTQNIMEVPRLSLKYKIHGQVPFKSVLAAFSAAGFEQTDENKWNVYWGMAGKETLKEMNRHQKTNHFPGCWSIGRKDNLWIHLSRMKRKFPKDFQFIPNTYLLAHDYDRFQAIRETAKKDQIWIKKPVAAARGIGITLINKKSKLAQEKKSLVMDYISNPHLINNFKYDLRVYVLITSIDPLRIYMYKDGLVRFATQEYSTKKQDIRKRFIHLTNFSVNKESPNFLKNQNEDESLEQSSKWSHHQYKTKLISMGVDTKLLFSQIQDVILKTCIVAEPLLLDPNGKSSEHRNNYFELYGFDILMDSNLKPWVLEVNVSPSLNSASPLDAQIKTKLISDMMHLVGIPCNKLRNQESKSLSIRHLEKNLNEIPNVFNHNFRSKVSQQDIDILVTSLEEQMRLGEFKCLYPNKKTIQNYDQYFEYQRYNNKLIQKYYQDGSNWQF